ncbi:hypothetical protein [Neobacillus drentensis]|uniref:hypothetical protein n=1 Tax=Neobacillus drentensis TaxID=220684 RepID=UPI002FFE7360
MKIKEVANLLDVSEITIRREVSKGSFGEVKFENGEYSIDYHHVLKFIAENPKYSDLRMKVVELMYEELELNKSDINTELHVEVLEAAILKSTISKFGTEVLQAFSSYLDKKESQPSLPFIIRAMDNKLNVIKQPTVNELQTILSEAISVDVHKKIKLGEMVNADQIENIFGRKPQQEGINFCKDTKELYIITKLGLDNPAVKKAEYNDYWKNGKIFYEGKGQGIQEFKGSNLHLYRKYEVFHQLVKCKEGVPSYIHVFNQAKIYEPDKFQYLGKFHVTDYFVDNQSLGRLQDTKTAIIFELTPIVKKLSASIDENYIF